jgi:hypothetical protein
MSFYNAETGATSVSGALALAVCAFLASIYIDNMNQRAVDQMAADGLKPSSIVFLQATE